MEKMEKFKLSDDQLQASLIEYAAGKTTSQIIDAIISKESLENTEHVRRNLQIQLRSVNPNDKKFATVKYGMLYELAREAALDIFREQAFKACSDVFASMSETLNDLHEIKHRLRELINNAAMIDINSNREFLETVKIYSSIPRVEADVLNARANLLKELSKFMHSKAKN